MHWVPIVFSYSNSIEFLDYKLSIYKSDKRMHLHLHFLGISKECENAKYALHIHMRMINGVCYLLYLPTCYMCAWLIVCCYTLNTYFYISSFHF